MKIQQIEVNNRKRCLEIETPKGRLSLPFSKLALIPSPTNKIVRAFVDKELANEGITYVLKSGKEDSVPLDAFLDYNRDPEYLNKMMLYKLTLEAEKLVARSNLSKREIARKLNTSPAHLYRLLDPTNYTKTIDQMVKLLTALGFKVDFRVQKEKAA